MDRPPWAIQKYGSGLTQIFEHQKFIVRFNWNLNFPYDGYQKKVRLEYYGAYSIIKQKAYEGGKSHALICMNFQL